VAQNWHKKETHEVPENPTILLLYLPTPVSGAVFLELRHRALGNDPSRIDTLGSNPCVSGMAFLLKTPVIPREHRGLVPEPAHCFPEQVEALAKTNKNNSIR
jgi:hypothetical protein